MNLPVFFSLLVLFRSQIFRVVFGIGSTVCNLSATQIQVYSLSKYVSIDVRIL